MEMVFLLSKRNPTNAKAEKLKEAKRELYSTYEKEQKECHQSKINKIRDLLEDRLPGIA